MLERVAAASGVTPDRAAELVAVLRDCVDEVLANDATVAIPPLMYGQRHDLVAQRVGQRFRDLGPDELVAMETGDAETMARWLGVDLDTYDQHPVVGRITLLLIALDRLGIDNRQQPTEAELVLDVLARGQTPSPTDAAIGWVTSARSSWLRRGWRRISTS